MARAEQSELFALAPDKAARLRLAIDGVPGLGNVRRNDLERLVLLYEERTTRAGHCDLSRAEICDRLRWNKGKLNAVRQLAEALRWIEVTRDRERHGGWASNRVRVDWAQIGRARLVDPPGSESDPPGSESDPPGSESDPPRAAPIKDLNSHVHVHEGEKNSQSQPQVHGARPKLGTVHPETLQDFAAIEELRPIVVAAYGLPDTPSGRELLHATARQALSGAVPGGLFRRLLERRAWTIPIGRTGSIEPWARAEARELIRRHDVLAAGVSARSPPAEAVPAKTAEPVRRPQGPAPEPTHERWLRERKAKGLETPEIGELIPRPREPAAT